MSAWATERRTVETETLDGRWVSQIERSSGSPGSQNCLRDVMSNCPVALCVVDDSRTIHFENPEFKHLARLCPVLGNGSRLAVQAHASSQDLRQAIADVIDGCAAVTLHLPLSNHAHDLTVLLTPMDQAGRVLLTIIPPRALMISTEQQHRALRLKWGFSQREAECAMQLGQGMTAQRMSDSQGVSLATIRTHLQSIREKMGVQNSLEAAIMIAGLSRPCGGLSV